MKMFIFLCFFVYLKEILIIFTAQRKNANSPGKKFKKTGWWVIILHSYGLKNNNLEMFKHAKHILVLNIKHVLL